MKKLVSALIIAAQSVVPPVSIAFLEVLIQ